jgi:hypothetical protein
VRALDGFGLGGTRWSPVETIVVNDRSLVRRTSPGRRDVVFRGDDRDRRDHPVFDRHPGRGRGHENHVGKPDTPGHAGDRDRDWRDDDRRERDRRDRNDDWRRGDRGDDDDD